VNNKYFKTYRQIVLSYPLFEDYLNNILGPDGKYFGWYLVSVHSFEHLNGSCKYVATIAKEVFYEN